MSIFERVAPSVLLVRLAVFAVMLVGGIVPTLCLLCGAAIVVIGQRLDRWPNV